MAPCGSPTDMLIIARLAGGVIEARSWFNRANGKSVNVSVRRGLNIDRLPMGRRRPGNAASPAEEGSAGLVIAVILRDGLAFHNKGIGGVLDAHYLLYPFAVQR